MIQKVPLLYLANDILQNSKRNGNEFVTEFWKVLPKALKDVIQKGDDRGKNVVSRLVGIWEERRVFGSRARSLKEVMLGEDVPPPLEFSSKKRSRSVKIVKRDSRSIRTKLSIGGVTEKIVSAYHLMLSEQPNEDAEMSKCKSAIKRIRKLEKDVETAYTTAKDPKRKTIAKELEEEENTLKQCIEKLKSAEAGRLAVVSQLKEALHEQESELENVQKLMQEASNMRKRLEDEDYVSKPLSNSTPSPADANATAGQAAKKSAAAIAAEVADRLAASTSSQLIMTSVLSTFAAEEAKNAGLTKTSTSASMDSVSKPEKSVPISDPNVFMSTQPLPAPPNHSYQSVLVPQPTMQNQAPHSQAQYHMLSNPVSQPYLQPGGGVMAPFGYGSISPLPPVPPPPPPHMVSPMVPPAQQPLQLAQQLPLPLTQQPPVGPSFRPLQPPGIVYYGHPHTSQ
ncbi:hypothetical protein TIFTF001_004250 [Ficus carica]|uniref:CID domain-containing protein n=1 Tax=Ficus carica TaxID=3494 RepID=A0AA87ZK84_FICCA|nr:hypothetical protein TIFTF001_004250 [Ficus carica]